MRFLLLAVIMLDGSIIITTKNQLVFIAIFSFICDILLFIPDSVNVPITSSGEQLSPSWSLAFSLTVITIIVFTLVLIWIITIRLSKKFRNPILIKKLKFFIAGISMFNYIAISVAITNYINTNHMDFNFRTKHK